MAGLESLPGPMRSVCGGRQGLVCRGVAGPRRSRARRSRAAEQSGVGWQLGLEAAMDGWREQGVLVGLKGAPGILGGRAQEGNRRGLGRGSRLPLRARGEGKGMTLLSGSGRSVAGRGARAGNAGCG